MNLMQYFQSGQLINLCAFKVIKSDQIAQRSLKEKSKN